MTKEIIKLYEDFFNTIEKDKISYIYRSMLWSQGLSHQLLRLYKRMIGKTL